MPNTRRTLLLAPLALAAGHHPAATAATTTAAIRIGTLRFGSVAWELDVMRTHGLDALAGLAIEAVEFASSQAPQVALQAGRVDVIVQDWLFVSRQRAMGADWTLSPTSAALGAVIAPAGSPVIGPGDLPGRRLGIAGSPLDKSWLLLRAHAARNLGIDLDAACDKTFGPPPLLAELAAAGRLDAVLTYWPFAARAEAAGARTVLAMESVVVALGASPGVPFVGWVFADSFARRSPEAVQGLVSASASARAILATSDAEWDRIASLTGAAGADELVRLRDWYRRGVRASWPLDGISPLYDLLAQIGGPGLVGSAAHLSPGTLWTPT